VKLKQGQTVTKICSHCGTTNKSQFPKGLVQQAQYGKGIKSLAVYLQNYHMIPFKQLLQSAVMHADETGTRVNASLHWMHVASNELVSVFGYHAKRGKEAINSFDIIPKYT